MEEKSKGKKILEILQENYEIESAQDLSSAIKDLFKDSLQEMMNAEFETSMGYKKYQFLGIEEAEVIETTISI